MHCVELIRRIAAELHSQAVVDGGNPWTPYEFATREAKRRDIDVESIAPGSVQLNGGRATFIPEEQLILHESIGSDFDRAFLVAHEIGHAELGDDAQEDCNINTVVKIDPARVEDPYSIGIDRIVDYGRKQRREVQMDLFAREFLLPRIFVRRLHLEEGLSASEIAKKLGAPFTVVAQQLFDALLLPYITSDKKEKKGNNFSLNKQQQRAADHRGCAYMLEAGPGTGKTQTLVARVESLIADGIDPQKILLLTFSNKAAGEMAERIALKNKEAAATMWIGTFHAFGLDIVRRFYEELGLPKDPRIIEKAEAVELLEKEYPRLNLIHYRDIHDPTQHILNFLAAISRAKDEAIDEVEYAILAQTMATKAATDDDQKRAQKAIEVSRVYAVYEYLKRQVNCIDFGDLVALPVRLLEVNTSIRMHFQNMYEHVLVDEYQDVNRSSIRLLSSLCGDGDNLWVVGDVKQSIYRFRGASSFNMQRFGKEDFPGGKRERLKINYRSVREITDAFSSFAEQMKVGDLESGLISNRGNCGHMPELRTVESTVHQSAAIVDTIEEMRRIGYEYRDQAILCTGNDKLSEIGQDLDRAGIPILFLGSLFERPEIKDLLAVLTLLTDRRATGLMRLGCWREFTMPISDVGIVIEHLQTSNASPCEWFCSTDLYACLSPKGQESLKALCLALDGFNHESTPWDVLSHFLLDRTRLAARLAESSKITDIARGIAIWQFMTFVKGLPSGQGLPITRLLDHIRRLLRLGDDRDLRQLPTEAQGLNAVRLMTIHGAKGLEFAVVHSPSINANTIPRTSSQPACLPPDGMIEGGVDDALEVHREGQAEEQECLFFVAASRARDRLFFYAPTKTVNGNNRALSPFLDRLNSSLKRTALNAITKIPSQPEAADINVSIDGRMLFRVNQIALYEVCPRRFFYTHVLQTGGKRTTSTFMRMHDAVRATVQAIVSGDVTPSSYENWLKAEFSKQELLGHGYENDYRKLALTMLRYFISSRESHSFETPSSFNLNFGREQLVILPDDVLVRSDGRRIFRKIQTGHKRSKDVEDIATAAFVLATREIFPNAVVEIVSLADEVTTEINLTQKKLQNRKEKISAILKNIREGCFPATPSSWVCPNCPAFFICGATPSGTLIKKF